MFLTLGLHFSELFNRFVELYDAVRNFGALPLGDADGLLYQVADEVFFGAEQEDGLGGHTLSHELLEVPLESDFKQELPDQSLLVYVRRHFRVCVDVLDECFTLLLVGPHVAEEFFELLRVNCS